MSQLILRGEERNIKLNDILTSDNRTFINTYKYLLINEVLNLPVNPAIIETYLTVFENISLLTIKIIFQFGIMIKQNAVDIVSDLNTNGCSVIINSNSDLIFALLKFLYDCKHNILLYVIVGLCSLYCDYGVNINRIKDFVNYISEKDRNTYLSKKCLYAITSESKPIYRTETDPSASYQESKQLGETALNKPQSSTNTSLKRTNSKRPDLSISTHSLEKDDVEQKHSESNMNLIEYGYNLRGLKFTNNSCYIDSVLIALFLLPNRIIENVFFRSDLSKNKREIQCFDNNNDTSELAVRKEIRKELVNIASNIKLTNDHNSKPTITCEKLRTVLKMCTNSKKTFHTSNTQDAGEFLLYLCGLFDFVNTTYISERNFLNIPRKKDKSDEYTSSSQIEQGPVVMIPNKNITPNLNFQTFVNGRQILSTYEDNSLFVHDGKTYNSMFETTIITSSTFLVFSVSRLGLDDFEKEVRNTDKISHINTIQLSEQNTLELYCIVVHDKNHYTCYIKIFDSWYFYNDMANPMFVETNFKNNNFPGPNPWTHGTLYFYRSVDAAY